MGRVFKACGNIWNSIGYVEEHAMQIFPEEALFLFERYGYQISCDGSILDFLHPPLIEAIFGITFIRYCVSLIYLISRYFLIDL